MNDGIDYGMGTANVDKATGIRYGVISQNECLQAWADAAESDYGEPYCPKCGNEAMGVDDQPECNYRDLEQFEGKGDYVCDNCKYTFDGEEAFSDEALWWVLDNDEYKATQSSDGDIFVLKSPYYTLCQFCSPCAPGAGYLLNEGGVKAYCFDKSWFPDNIAPYKVYSVETNELIT